MDTIRCLFYLQLIYYPFYVLKSLPHTETNALFFNNTFLAGIYFWLISKMIAINVIFKDIITQITMATYVTVSESQCKKIIYWTYIQNLKIDLIFLQKLNLCNKEILNFLRLSLYLLEFRKMI
jgi:hypothetical protein